MRNNKPFSAIVLGLFFMGAGLPGLEVFRSTQQFAFAQEDVAEYEEEGGPGGRGSGGPRGLMFELMDDEFDSLGVSNPEAHTDAVIQAFDEAYPNFDWNQ